MSDDFPGEWHDKWKTTDPRDDEPTPEELDEYEKQYKRDYQDYLENWTEEDEDNWTEEDEDLDEHIELGGSE